MTTLFITGIDTNIGKTVACGALANTLLAQDHHVFTQKWVETGCENGISKDLDTHQKIAGKEFNTASPKQHSPYVFTYPASPHLAAKLQHTQIDCDYLQTQTLALQKQCDHLLIEGAGGLCVPLTEKLLIIDLVVQMQLSIVLVTSGRLGSINHTLLSLQACRQKNVRVQAVIYNQYGGNSEEITADTRYQLQQYLCQHFPATQWLELPANSTSIKLSTESDILTRR